MNKKKRVMKSKEELLNDLKGNVKFAAKMKFTKEVFYPALYDASKNIEDTTSFLSSLNTMIMTEFLGKMKEYKMKDFKITDKLDPEDPKYEKVKALIQIFDEMDVFEAKEFIEGMKNEIELFKNEEMKTRSLASLKTKWLDEL